MKSTLIVISCCLALAPTLLTAGPITFSFTQGSRGGSATFSKSGSNLIVTLTNTAIADVVAPGQILSALFFQLDGDTPLTRASAILASGSGVYEGGTGTAVPPMGGVVGGEWAYRSGIASDLAAQGIAGNQGISSAGLNIFGEHDLFPGVDLQPPPAPSGVNYGITSAGDDLTTANGGLAGRNLIKNAVVVTLGNFTGEPNERISQVSFQYGTVLGDVNEPNIPGTLVPEPQSLTLLGLGVCGLLASARRMRRAAARR